jgi:hypothetical protein
MAVGEGTLSSLLEQLYKDYRGIETQRGERYQAGLGELAEAAGLFGPGYGVGMEREALAGAKQSLIGRGLGGTTRPMAVSAGMKAQFEDLRRGRLAEALGQMAGYRRTFPEGTATAGILSHLATGGFSGGLEAARLGLAQQTALAQGVPVGGGRVYGGTYGASSFPDMFSIPGERIGGAGGVAGTVGTPDFSMPGVTGGAGVSGAPPAGSPAALWAGSPETWGASLEAERMRAGLVGDVGTPATTGDNVWKRGDYAEWLRVTGRTNSAEALQAFNAAKGTPK